MLLVDRFSHCKQNAEVPQMISNRLKELRKKRNVKVSDIIETLDISQPYYYDVESGKKRLNEDLLHKFADFYKVTTDFILARTESENNVVLEGDSLPDELKPYVDAIAVDKNRVLSPEELKIVIAAAVKIKENN